MRSIPRITTDAILCRHSDEATTTASSVHSTQEVNDALSKPPQQNPCCHPSPLSRQGEKTVRFYDYADLYANLSWHKEDCASLWYSRQELKKLKKTSATESKALLRLERQHMSNPKSYVNVLEKVYDCFCDLDGEFWPQQRTATTPCNDLFRAFRIRRHPTCDIWVSNARFVEAFAKSNSFVERTLWRQSWKFNETPR